MVYSSILSIRPTEGKILRSDYSRQKKHKVSFASASTEASPCTRSCYSMNKLLNTHTVLPSKQDENISRSASIYFNSGEQNVLMLAARDGDFDLVQALVSTGLPLDAVDFQGYTALMYACRDGHTAIVRFLLDSGANPAICTKSGYSALLAASLNGFADIVNLLGHLIDVNECDDEGYTPLICASMNNHADTVEVLLNCGALTSCCTIEGLNAMMIAVQTCSIEVIDVFIHHHIVLQSPISFTTTILSSSSSHHHHSIGVLYYAARTHRSRLLHHLISHSFYLRQFIHDLTYHPDLTIETIMEHTLLNSFIRNPSSFYHLQGWKELLLVLDEGVQQSIEQLQRVYERGSIFAREDENSQVRDCSSSLSSSSSSSLSSSSSSSSSSPPLAGLVEATVWCTRIYKHLSSNSSPPGLTYFFPFVERCLEEWNVLNSQSIEKWLPSQNSFKEEEDKYDDGYDGYNSCNNCNNFDNNRVLIQKQKRGREDEEKEDEEEMWNQQRRKRRKRRRKRVIVTANKEKLDDTIRLRTKLLFSFLEIYSIGMASMTVADHSNPFYSTTTTTTALHLLSQIHEVKYVINPNVREMALSPSSRLQTLFGTHKEFLRDLIQSNPDLYRCMIYFAKEFDAYYYGYSRSF